MEAKRKGTGKERTILHYIFYRNHIYNILILTVSLISDGSVTSPPCAFKRLALTGIGGDMHSAIKVNIYF